MQTNNNIGFGAVSLKQLKIGTAVQFNKLNQELAGQIRQVTHIGAEPALCVNGMTGTNPSRKIIHLTDLGKRGQKVSEKISCPVGDTIPYLDLLA